MGIEIGVGSTVAVMSPLCFRAGVDRAAACGAPWLTTRWAVEWRYVRCPGCRAKAPPGADLPRETPPEP